MIVVSDTSPLSYLHQIGRLDLLKVLYGRIVIPPAVEMELRAAPRLHGNLDWSTIEVVSPAAVDQVDALLQELDRGESEAIVVALELKADLLLIDEVSGREVARRMGLRRTGLLGVLLDAKGQGIIPSITDELDRLVERTNFRIHPQVRGEVLRLAGEGDLPE